jgi:hypothetical protein
MALHLKHFPQTTKEKENASKIVGISHVVKTIGHPWKQLNNLSQTFSSLLIITYSNFKVKEGIEDGVRHRLLECSHRQKVYRLDKKNMQTSC